MSPVLRRAGAIHRWSCIKDPPTVLASVTAMCLDGRFLAHMRVGARWSVLVLLCLVPPPSVAAPYTDYKESGVQYDEYPVVVPKRAAMLLDRIMVALQKAVDEDNVRPIKQRIPIEETMDLQRRGQQKGGRIYWRCYFNAVTCF